MRGIPDLLPQAKGTPTQLMQQHLRAMLARLRLTVPFEIDKFELLGHCLPKDWNGEGNRWANARQSMHFGEVVFFQLIQKGTEEVSSSDAIFWVNFGQKVPMPREAMTSFEVMHDFRYALKLEQWLEQAEVLNSAIMSATKLTTSYVGAMTHPTNVAQHWPDLYKFIANVGASNRTFNKDVKTVPSHIAATAKLDAKVAASIITMLTTASLLPDTPPIAWVGFHK